MPSFGVAQEMEHSAVHPAKKQKCGATDVVFNISFGILVDKQKKRRCAWCRVGDMGDEHTLFSNPSLRQDDVLIALLRTVAWPFGETVALKNMTQLMMCMCIMAHHMRSVHGATTETCLSLLDFYKKITRPIFCGMNSKSKTDDSVFDQDTEAIERELGTKAVEGTITTTKKQHPLSQCFIFNARSNKPLTPWCIKKMPLTAVSWLQMILVWKGTDEQVVLHPNSLFCPVGQNTYHDVPDIKKT